MDFSCASMKVLLFLMIVLPPTSANTHSLQFLYTAITPGLNVPEFTAVGLVDGEQIVYYDSNVGKMIPKMEWIQNINFTDPDYQKSPIQDMQSHHETLHDLLLTVMEKVNRAKGVHTLQRMYGCELDDDGTIGGYDQFGYDGEDFISLDLKTGTWTAANDKALLTKHKWESKGAEAEYWKDYLEKECIEELKKYVFDGRETLERKVPPKKSLFQKHSCSPEVVCLATGFFPKAVKITWRKDGEDVREGVVLNETLPIQDGSFQKRSILKVPAEELQKHTYTCVIQHSSLEKELVLPVSERRILSKHRGEESDVLVAVVRIVVAVLSVAMILSLHALMECLFGVRGYLVISQKQ